MLAHDREELSEVIAAARLAFEAASAHHGLVAQLVLRQLLCPLAACLGLARDGFNEEVDLLVARLRQVETLAAQCLQQTLALGVDGGTDATVDVVFAHPAHRARRSTKLCKLQCRREDGRVTPCKATYRHKDQKVLLLACFFSERYRHKDQSTVARAHALPSLVPLNAAAPMDWPKMPRGSAGTKKDESKLHVLERLLATSAETRKADFGSIRFKGSRRPAPSKYARIACSNADNVKDFIRPLLFETWGLRKPSALISVLGTSGAEPLFYLPLAERKAIEERKKMYTNDPTKVDPTKAFDKTQDLLVFSRGLVEAATTTNAWVVTDGLADGVAAVCGRALRESNVPLLGVTPWRSIADHSEIEAGDKINKEGKVIKKKKNGQVHLYDSNNDASEPLRFCGCAKSIKSPGGYSKGIDGGDCACPAELVQLYEQHMLEGNHTHFLFVDNGVLKPQLGSEIPLREAMERYLVEGEHHQVEGEQHLAERPPPGEKFRHVAERLVSGENERMPLIFLVINGDESTL